MSAGTYPTGLIIVGLAILGAVVLPRLVEREPLSFPILYVGAGAVLFAVVPGTPTIDPVEQADVTERLTELVVIVSLMGAGLKLDRPFSIRGWSPAWRLLGITFPLTIATVALLGWSLLGLLPATAVLLGAVIAPTDPVLAADVDAGAPLTELEEETAETDVEQRGSVRFALTSEAGMNDGLAFPFTNLAIAAAGAGTAAGFSWLGEWFLVDVVYKLVVGVVLGYLVGYGMARFIFREPETPDIADVMAGAEALAATLVAYGVTELAMGYGFIAVFVAALALRHYEWRHAYYRHLHDFAVIVERLLIATVLVLFGGALAGGLLAPLTPLEGVLALVVLLVVRPLAGLAGFLGSAVPWANRVVVSLFGIRGIGSFYYLAFALAHASFREVELLVAADQLWAFVGAVVLGSIVIHGVSADFVMRRFDRYREASQS